MCMRKYVIGNVKNLASAHPPLFLLFFSSVFQDLSKENFVCM